MVELLRSPEKMGKARSELLEVIRKDGLVQESDISRLPYLQAVVKETLRLHPPAPFVIRRKCEADVEVQGFMVPKNAQVLFNLWASGRDSNVWLNAESFTPERFLDCDIDYRGQHCELIPFGAGKRICPGLPLGHKMMHLMLGSLLYSFDWKLEGEMKPEDIDMSEKFGLTLRKAVTLKAIPLMSVSNTI